MALTNGTYVPKNSVRVTVWAPPDVNGDGEDLWADNFDDAGNYQGREPVEDNGRPVRLYQPPEGFMRVPTQNPGTDGASEAWVRSNGRGQVYRNRDGHAVQIKPGTVLLEYPDGSHELLETGYAQRRFEETHERQGGVDDGV